MDRKVLIHQRCTWNLKRNFQKGFKGAGVIDQGNGKGMEGKGQWEDGEDAPMVSRTVPSTVQVYARSSRTGGMETSESKTGGNRNAGLDKMVLVFGWGHLISGKRYFVKRPRNSEWQLATAQVREHR